MIFGSVALDFISNRLRIGLLDASNDASKVRARRKSGGHLVLKSCPKRDTKRNCRYKKNFNSVNPYGIFERAPSGFRLPAFLRDARAGSARTGERVGGLERIVAAAPKSYWRWAPKS